MLVLNGLYVGNDTVKLDPMERPLPKNTPVKITVPDSSDTGDGEIKKSKDAFQNLLKFKGTLTMPIDIKKERLDYLEEKYGHTH